MVSEKDFNEFVLLHEAQLLSSGVPQHFWQTLHIKLKNQTFDANNVFALFRIDYEDKIRNAEDPTWIVQVQCEEGVKYNDERHIYLVDHAWTFRLNQARQQLQQMPNLSDRMCNIMGIESESEEERVNEVCRHMWKFCQTYSISNEVNVEDRLPVWYIMDEVGGGLQHSYEPNFRAVPFVYAPEQMTYTLLFPIKDTKFEEQVTRDFVENVSDESKRQALLLPWCRHDFTNVNFNQEEPDESYFLSGHIKESLPLNQDFEVAMPQTIKVFAEYDLVQQFLTNPRFEITDDETTADILWYIRHFKSYAELSETPNKFINQFPFEYVLTIKDLLSIVCRRKSENKSNLNETISNWYPTTYNLKTELVKFVSYYQNREKLRLDNYWICKPWNLARSLDTYITNDLTFIVRLSETGPKIAQKYIHNPVLFYRPECNGKVKFDVRYVILLKSVQPLKAYIYNNFFLRFANKPFELNDFDDYEKHFTVMNYKDEAELHHLRCADFLVSWHEQYPEYPWRDIEKKILNMLREVLDAAVMERPPRGIAQSPQSRAVYAADIMLSWDSPQLIQPKLLEINWTPDCKRACDYYPDFYDDIFACLFLNEELKNSFTSL